MLSRKIWFVLLTLSVAVLNAPAFSSTATPQAQELIETLGLSEADTPISKHPGWKPSKIVVMLPSKTGFSGAEYEEQLRNAAGDVELVIDRSGSFIPSEQILAGADGVIGICTSPLLKNADENLVWLHNYYVGMDHCTGATDTQLQEVVFTNNKRLSGPAIAEHAIAMLLALTHNLPAYSGAQSEAKWDRALADGVTFGELTGKTLLVVGLGGIGTEIAWRANGLGMRVIATRNSSREGPDYVAKVGLADELHALAGEADVIVNALPLTPQTTGIFDKAFFESVKPGAIFLSVGRGKSTVTRDLIAALESGQLFGAGLDVTDPEPLPADSPLWHLPNVIITPHVSSAGGDSPERTMIIAVENLRRYVNGEPLLNIVDMQKGY
ncbi:Glyoxylate/hydroxypyruvate reductase A [Halioglobus japonicus]|nr:Glyoxylate/hydroxypyruvate reductase A [Halioglobus japonicus]